MSFEIYKTDGIDKVLGKAEQSKNPIIAEDRRWADDIRSFRSGFPWEGSHIHEAYKGLEFQFAGSPNKTIAYGFEGKEDELLALDLDPKQQLSGDLKMAAKNIRAHRAYSEKHAQGGVTLDIVKSKDPEKKVPEWVGRISYEASGKVFRDIPAIHDYLREMAEKNQEK